MVVKNRSVIAESPLNEQTQIQTPIDIGLGLTRHSECRRFVAIGSAPSTDGTSTASRKITYCLHALKFQRNFHEDAIAGTRCYPLRKISRHPRWRRGVAGSSGYVEAQ
ncbi:hypothetical protein AcW2_005731 [Taiwanofungus camphoratus]|nr:hypothetical protein AcW2_005731 [Antrodia cinnamomea]